MKTYTVPEVARKLGVTAHAVHYAIRRGTLKALVPRDTMISEHELARYIARRKRKTSETQEQVETPEETFHPLIFQ